MKMEPNKLINQLILYYIKVDMESKHKNKIYHHTQSHLAHGSLQIGDWEQLSGDILALLITCWRIQILEAKKILWGNTELMKYPKVYPSPLSVIKNHIELLFIMFCVLLLVSSQLCHEQELSSLSQPLRLTQVDHLAWGMIKVSILALEGLKLWISQHIIRKWLRVHCVQRRLNLDSIT